MNKNNFKESKYHGKKDFPLVVYKINQLENTPHWHEQYEFIYIDQGKTSLLIEGENVNLKSGETAFIDRYLSE